MTGTDDDPHGAREGDAAPDPAVYDHLRPAGASVDPGVYRVVGTGDPLALLRVGDADGRRVATGRLVRVDRDALSGFEPADNPDGNRPPGAAVAGALETVGWQLRTFARGLAARPLATLLAVVVLVVGLRGDRYVSAPDTAFLAAYVAGAVALVYLGRGGG